MTQPPAETRPPEQSREGLREGHRASAHSREGIRRQEPPGVAGGGVSLVLSAHVPFSPFFLAYNNKPPCAKSPFPSTHMPWGGGATFPNRCTCNSSEIREEAETGSRP